MLLLGIDVGSSSVKASVIDGETGTCLESAFMPKNEMEIRAVKPGWAEQDPEIWWQNLCAAVKTCTNKLGRKTKSVGAVGISYQMHGLVVVGKDHKPLRDSVIWCDSRAVPYGTRALEEIGKEKCLSSLLNSPGNFTASKLAWVKENEPDLFRKIFKIMLPGDYIALKLTGEIKTTYSGLSEGILWDFTGNRLSSEVMEFFGFDENLIPDSVPSFSLQGRLMENVADELGLPSGIPVSYRAGDQPNNALSLNVLSPGEVAATAGTSGVIYGVTEAKKYDPESRVNTFLHVNHTFNKPRLGVLLCINGTGIMNSWIKKITSNSSYDQMNDNASSVSPGSDGLSVLPFGNGAERMLMNTETGSVISGLNFNIHTSAHIYRAIQEGIAFSFRHGLDIMKTTGIEPQVLRAGSANMFLSPVFRSALATVTGTVINLFNTDGAAGAARGAGIGCGYFRSEGEAFGGLKTVNITEPDTRSRDAYIQSYERWKNLLEKMKYKIQVTS